MSLHGSKRIAYEIAVSLLVLSAIVATHELGHVVFGLAAGKESQVLFISGNEGLGLGAYGFATTFPSPLTQEETRYIAFGGIAFNAMAAVLFYFLYKKTKNIYLKDFLFVLIVASIMSVFLNALPIEPFDGSRLV